MHLTVMPQPETYNYKLYSYLIDTVRNWPTEITVEVAICAIAAIVGINQPLTETVRVFWQVAHTRGDGERKLPANTATPAWPVFATP
jgi:hypothetical protein